MAERRVEKRATEWLRSYHGSIDSRALTLAFIAGHRDGVAMIRQGEVQELVEALREASRQLEIDIVFSTDEAILRSAARCKIVALLDRYQKEAVTRRSVPEESQEPASEDAETGASSDD